MLDKAKTLEGYTLDSLDGTIGKVKEFYFDDHHWTIRYLVADTGTWLTSRQVLISPYALTGVNKEGHDIAVNLTTKQIEGSPTLDSHKPVSRQFEEFYYQYYGWTPYWGGPSVWGSYPRPYMSGAYPHLMGSREQVRESALHEKASWDHHLRSTLDVTGHHIQAADGEIGHVVDFIIDDKSWTIQYLIVDTRNWWPGKKVLLSPKWIERVSWPDKTVAVSLSRDNIRQSPEYSEESLLTRDYETRLHRHYQRKGYWIDEPAETVLSH